MAMNLMELKAQIDDYVEMVGEEKAYDVEVRFASQPNWPFEYSINADITSSEEDVLYLAEGEQLGYLPGYVKEQLGW